MTTELVAASLPPVVGTTIGGHIQFVPWVSGLHRMRHELAHESKSEYDWLEESVRGMSRSLLD